MRKVPRFVGALVAGIFVMFSVGCQKGSPAGPSGPVDPNAPKDGPIAIAYQRPAGMTCQAVGGPYEEMCTHSVRVTTERWPEGYGFMGLTMAAGSGDTFSASAIAPAQRTPKLGIYILDPWLCPPDRGCNFIAVGRGITINGVPLTDVQGVEGEERAFFGFSPPTVIP